MRPRGNRPPSLAIALVATLLVSLGLLHGGDAQAAGPTVGELLALCERALGQGFQGRDAAACEWFAAPCACKPREPGEEAEPWCVPDAEPLEATVRKVVDALRREPDRESHAGPAVRAALGRIYPCSSVSPRPSSQPPASVPP
jgi:hypothetical protein